MKRLNEYVEAQKFLETLDWDNIPDSGEPLATICEALQDIQNYKDLDEQGLLLRLPVKAGDTVYALRYGEENDFIIVETKIIEIRQNMYGIFFEPLISRKAYKTEDFGKEVFLTREEAEQKLKEMESDLYGKKISNRNGDYN